MDQFDVMDGEMAEKERQMIGVEAKEVTPEIAQEGKRIARMLIDAGISEDARLDIRVDDTAPPATEFPLAFAVGCVICKQFSVRSFLRRHPETRDFIPSALAITHLLGCSNKETMVTRAGNGDYRVNEMELMPLEDYLKQRGGGS